ncbi:MAG: tRNA dihydrouridine synthase DusB [Gammaproteobacteria bacterium 39-13]|nr:tRNA dihydrouridine synthase DusB [Gammaproteobacteria bacterium]OJV85633.1 MAG: tRNA dihydrouridine synthase DusB [Gammaproteobacteria bacterium 39-13]
MSESSKTTKPAKLKIGPFEIDNPIILAPMAGVTDRPFRQLCKNLGAGLAVSEMVGANSLLHGSEKTKRRANHEGETRPCSVQIVGADPNMMAQAASYNEAQGAEIIDINMGCPAKKVCNTLSGSALLKDEPLVAKILEQVVSAVKIPVTLKIRTGWDTHHRNGVNIAKMAESCGIQALAIHGRTRACMFNGEAEYDTIAAIKQAVSIPIIANGDINTPEKAKLVLEKTGADAIMIGRAAQGRPWIFREIMHYLVHQEHYPAPSNQMIRDVMINHMKNLYAFYGEDRGVLVARKHVSWYSKGQRHGGAFRHAFNQLNNAQAQLDAAETFFATVMELEQ